MRHPDCKGGETDPRFETVPPRHSWYKRMNETAGAAFPMGFRTCPGRLPFCDRRIDPRRHLA
jgi:hypothetical protein